MSRGKNGLRLPTLKYMLELTSRCNLRCGMCPMDALTRPFEDAPWDMVEDVSRQMKSLGLKMRYLHEMGEPFLYKRLPEAIDLFPGVCVSTNATLLSEEWAKRVLHTSLSKIRLCIDTLKPDAYPIVRKGGKFDVVVENIRRFLEMSKGKKIVVEIQRMVTTQTHDESVRDFREFFRLDRYPQATIIQKTCEGLDTSEVTELHQAYYGCFQGTPYQWFVILCNGDVTHCCYDYDGTQKLGNVRRDSIEEIAASPFLDTIEEAFRRQDFTKLPLCAECFKNPAAKPPLTDRIWRYAQLFPWKDPLRRFLNVPGGEN
ncbi:MAG TPA: SPASM domain-containing protein [Thermoanaerobaculia bacterium]|nr:SPASM domain-containing protein [Thermoanaerobaculia bacterium]